MSEIVDSSYWSVVSSGQWLSEIVDVSIQQWSVVSRSFNNMLYWSVVMVIRVGYHRVHRTVVMSSGQMQCPVVSCSVQWSVVSSSGQWSDVVSIGQQQCPVVNSSAQWSVVVSSGQQQWSVVVVKRYSYQSLAELTRLQDKQDKLSWSTIIYHLVIAWC